MKNLTMRVTMKMRIRDPHRKKTLILFCDFHQEYHISLTILESDVQLQIPLEIQHP